MSTNVCHGCGHPLADHIDRSVSDQGCAKCFCGLRYHPPKRCDCRAFTAASSPGGVIDSWTMTSHPQHLDGVYWFLVDGPQDVMGFAMPLVTCPWCSDPVREVNP